LRRTRRAKAAAAVLIPPMKPPEGKLVLLPRGISTYSRIAYFKGAARRIDGVCIWIWHNTSWPAGQKCRRCSGRLLHRRRADGWHCGLTERKGISALSSLRQCTFGGLRGDIHPPV
ncbi:hypothetical protein TcCL_NonESM08262, partial [Trypanosoma cruzi]